MANQDHLEVLSQGVTTWNRWRQVAPELLRAVDLEGAELSRVYLPGINLTRANLKKANFQEAKLSAARFSEAQLNGARFAGADLRRACLEATFLIGTNLAGANLIGAHLDYADLREANLREADLLGATLWEADLRGADLRGARLIGATLVESNLEEANLSDSSVYGVSAWKVRLAGAIQLNLNISDRGEPAITVDNIEVAQFIYLLLNNEKLHQVVDTITSKVVLILGRFTLERKEVLETIRQNLRKNGYVPVLFDFTRPTNLNLTETVTLIARMARFIIADLTEPMSIAHELMSIVPHVAVPVQPLLKTGHESYSMREDLRLYKWYMEEFRYDDLNDLASSLSNEIISRAEAKRSEILLQKS
jgi:Pentapeptide repeats (8 copies)